VVSDAVLAERFRRLMTAIDVENAETLIEITRRPSAVDVSHADQIVGRVPSLQACRNVLAQHQQAARCEGRSEVLKALLAALRAGA
jgi:hypothetical protein